MLGHDTEKITVEGKFGGKLFTWERYMAPSLGAAQRSVDQWRAESSTIPTAIATGEQDESLLKKPANVEVVSATEFHAQYFAARGNTR